MLALLAAVGALVVALLLWRSFAGQRIGVPSTPRRARSLRTTTPTSCASCPNSSANAGTKTSRPPFTFG